MSNLKHEGCMCAPRLTLNAVQHKNVKLRKKTVFAKIFGNH